MANRDGEGKSRPLGNHPPIHPPIDMEGRLAFQMPHDDLDLDVGLSEPEKFPIYDSDNLTKLFGSVVLADLAKSPKFGWDRHFSTEYQCRSLRHEAEKPLPLARFLVWISPAMRIACHCC